MDDYKLSASAIMGRKLLRCLLKKQREAGIVKVVILFVLTRMK
jgi:hypothetical protein